jgi:hypothetical protein
MTAMTNAGRFLPQTIFAAVLSMGATVAFAQGAESVTGTVGNVMEKFNNWEVRQLPGNNTYFLVGEPLDSVGQLWLQCEHKSFLTVAVSMSGKGGRQGLQKSQVVTLKVDDAAPRDFNFIVFESFVAMATEFPGATDERVSGFMEALRDVKNNLVLTYDHTSHQFGVADLPKARARFLQLCGRSQAAR